MTRRNLRLLIAYDGGAYSGWQRQQNAPTIQGTIEDRLAVITGNNITLHGAGRTDAGVHATGMVANFATGSAIPCSGLMNGLNSMLPKDIRIRHVDEADENFHSRFNATGKTYCYTFFTGPIQLPTERLYTAHYHARFDDQMVRQALDHLLGLHDFASFEATGSRDATGRNSRGAIRTLFQAELATYPGKINTWFFTFTGDGFLRHMIRNLVGTLMDVGSGKTSPEEFRAVLQCRDRNAAGPTAPACGLTLKTVHYLPLSPDP